MTEKRITKAEALAKIEHLRSVIEHMSDTMVPAGDWLTATCRTMCETMLGDREGLRIKVREQAAELDRMRPVYEAAKPMRRLHEGCVTEPACGACFRCDFDAAVDAALAKEKP